MRLLILIIVVYLGYRLFRTWILPKKSTERMPPQGQSPSVDDVMVKDPFCETYFPRRQGVSYSIKGQTLYFCSTLCRDKYIEARTGKKAEDE